ncbi:MAG: DNA polymerase III subunit gamma/tau [Acidobacteria bacterium]|nr:DNA polymerase III subunit gamma/tau [Acidobacteriota bacterium]
MAARPSTPTSIDGVTSLYRRFRPGRFAELRGQDHVVRALQGAVARDRVSHAYLFSGPRGTGKTTTARILAKALNCEHPLEGDACNVCASCVAITRGSSLDVTELDAASNNGVDDIREITAGAWHGTPGRWKIYIFDEVHQLSKPASAALLKTLEEPPPHVVFVLATTDPHKVLPTIRSRTQHLEFRLIGGDTLSTLLHDVQGAAGLAVDDTTIETAVRLGRGSARDALSALDQLLATGATDETLPDFDGLFQALVDGDAVGGLTTLARLTGDGWDPEQLAESFAAEVRQAFLLQVAPDVADAVDTDRARLSEWGRQMGLARTVRVLESFGRALREMKSAPEKLVVLEVVMVRLTRPELDATLDALAERVTNLERQERSSAPVAATPPAPTALRPIGATAPTATAPTATAPTSGPSRAPAATSAPPVPVEPPSTDSASPTVEEVRRRFVERVIPRTSRGAQLVLKSATVVDFDGSRITLAVASEEIRQNTDQIAQGLKGALDHEFRVPLTVGWVVDPGLRPASPSAPRAHHSATPAPEPAADFDESSADDPHGPIVTSVAEHLITEMFPGAEEIS